MQTDKFKKQFK